MLGNVYLWFGTGAYKCLCMFYLLNFSAGWEPAVWRYDYSVYVPDLDVNILFCLLQIRRPIGTTFEILVPIVAVLVLVAFRYSSYIRNAYIGLSRL